MVQSESEEKQYPVESILTCKNCGGHAFSFSWLIESEEHLIHLVMCHSGIGLQLTDARVKCEHCGTMAKYKGEDFLTIVDLPVKS